VKKLLDIIQSVLTDQESNIQFNEFNHLAHIPFSKFNLSVKNDVILS
jgi:hypothetical protein